MKFLTVCYTGTLLHNVVRYKFYWTNFFKFLSSAKKKFFFSVFFSKLSLKLNLESGTWNRIFYAHPKRSKIVTRADSNQKGRIWIRSKKYRTLSGKIYGILSSTTNEKLCNAYRYYPALLPVLVAYSDWWLGHWRRSIENLWIMRKVSFTCFFGLFKIEFADLLTFVNNFSHIFVIRFGTCRGLQITTCRLGQLI